MNAYPVLLSLLMTVSAVLVQNSVFKLVRPFGEIPEVVLLAVIACIPWLKPELGVFLGFTGGLVLDLFGTAPLGLNALAFTLAAYVTVRMKDIFNYGLYMAAMAVGLITFVMLCTVALVGTLFGEGTLGSMGIIRTLLLVPLYNTVLGLGVLPLTRLMFGFRSSRSTYRPRA